MEMSSFVRLRLAEGIWSLLVLLPQPRQIASDDVGTPVDCRWLGILGSLQIGTYVFYLLLSLSEQRGPGCLSLLYTQHLEQ